MALVGAFSVNASPSSPSHQKTVPEVGIHRPAGRTHSDHEDSGVDDLSAGSESSEKSPRSGAKKEETNGEGGGSDAGASDTDQPAPKIMPENPFETETSQILFEAINDLQTWGASKYLEIPQLLIVGGQSSGKSSLLQTLTGIPFPTDAGCCTRWPTRVISKRTTAGEEDKFRVTIEGPEVFVSGLLPAEENYTSYEHSGSKLTMEEFERIMEEVSAVLGIRKGTGLEDKNFAAEVLKIELSGPKRSYFSILDLPGYISNNKGFKPGDAEKIEELLVEYISKPENIVVCVADIATNLNLQDIPGKLINLHVPDKEQTIGVFTKCDLGEKDTGMAQLAVNESFESGPEVGPRNWFYVRNKLKSDPEDLDLEAAERKLFALYPWNSLPKDCLGSTALKNHLGTMLNSKIAECFPKIEQDLHQKLEVNQSERNQMGAPRKHLSDKSFYIVDIAHKFKEKVDMVLSRPGYQDPALEIRWQVRELKKDFTVFMRTQGAVWQFEEDELDVTYTRRGFLLTDDDTDLPQAYSDIAKVKSSTELRHQIQVQLDRFQVLQPDGITNPDVFHKIYQLQVRKWTAIAERFLLQVRAGVQASIMAILEEVCPHTSGTKKVLEELKKLIDENFKYAYEVTRKECFNHCNRETNCTRLVAEDIDFSEEFVKRRDLRELREKKARAQSPETTFGFGQANPNKVPATKHVATSEAARWGSPEFMVNHVHDVTKCYYKLSLDFFIWGMTTIIEEFVAGDEGPLRWLSPKTIAKMSPETLELLGSEDKFTQKRREQLEAELSNLEGALNIVEKASQQTRDHAVL